MKKPNALTIIMLIFVGFAAFFMATIEPTPQLLPNCTTPVTETCLVMFEDGSGYQREVGQCFLPQFGCISEED